uniref:Gamma-conopressin vil n=1 Tax=Conus villepinii TaxID=257347 RepID=CONOV_CONVL|nr:RecName: Full=Gamma-conopressin vil [Conus villepinii]
CLIQDCPEG